MTISIVTDSTADLPADALERYHIRVVPSLVIFGGESFRDGIDLSRAQFYRRLAESDRLPTTAAPGVGGFEEAYAAMPPGSIISIHTAASLSGIFNSARLAAQAFGDRVTVVDSGSLSMGVGFQALAAAEAGVWGAAVAEVLDAIASVRRRLKVYALLDSLNNLRRGGRISLLRASVATVLRIKPLIELTDGVPIQVATERTRGRAMADLLVRVRAIGRLEKLAIIYTDNRELAVEVRDRIGNQCASGPLIVQAAPTIGTHLGPSSVGVVVVKYE